MKEELEGFFLQIPEAAQTRASELIDYFLYFSTVVREAEYASARDIEKCFEILRIPKYSNISSYLGAGARKRKGASPKFVVTGSGYQLARHRQIEMQQSLRTGPARIETSLVLRALLPKLADVQQRNFLQEAINCYEIGARRAAIVLTWMLAVRRLQECVLSNHVIAFNAAVAAQPDKRLKGVVVSSLDDFGDIPEGKLIELLRTIGVISNDVRKILEVKLGIRNSAAHPSTTLFSEVKATDFITDLVENVVIKF